MRSELKRREFLKVSGAGALSLALSGCTGTPGSRHPHARRDERNPAERERPNILFLFTDDQRFDTIAALGNSEIQTPHMDRLVQNGTSFTNTYILGALHGAVCMPSRAMLLTGRHYFNLPLSVIETWGVPDEQRGQCPYATFPEIFRHAGYDTFTTGKWHNGRPLLAKGFAHGGAIFFGGMCNHLKVPAYDFDPTGVYPNESKFVREKFSSELFADAAIDFLDRRATDNPFLMYVSFTAPHDPRMAPKEYAKLYPPEQITLPPNFLPEHPFPIGDLRIRDEKLAPFPRTPEAVREHIAAYYAMITHLDAQIGRIHATLERSGQADNTIVVLSSDNGLAVGQHGLLGKQNVYEHSSRVPLVISGPGIPRGERRNALCYLHDVCPTLCYLAGLPIPDSVQTHSLTPLLRDKNARVRDSIFMAYSTNSGKTKDGQPRPRGVLRAVRQGNWKLIKTGFDDTRRTLLFDLQSDPWETRNLADEAAQSKRVAQMETLLRDHIRATNDDLDLTKLDWTTPP